MPQISGLANPMLYQSKPPTVAASNVRATVSMIPTDCLFKFEFQGLPSNPFIAPQVFGGNATSLFDESTATKGDYGQTASSSLPNGVFGAEGTIGPKDQPRPDGRDGSKNVYERDKPFGSKGLFGPDGPFGAKGIFGPDGPFGSKGTFGPGGPFGPSGPFGLKGLFGPKTEGVNEHLTPPKSPGNFLAPSKDVVPGPAPQPQQPNQVILQPAATVSPVILGPLRAPSPLYQPGQLQVGYPELQLTSGSAN